MNHGKNKNKELVKRNTVSSLRKSSSSKSKNQESKNESLNDSDTPRTNELNPLDSTKLSLSQPSTFVQKSPTPNTINTSRSFSYASRTKELPSSSSDSTMKQPPLRHTMEDNSSEKKPIINTLRSFSYGVIPPRGVSPESKKTSEPILSQNRKDFVSTKIIEPTNLVQNDIETDSESDSDTPHLVDWDKIAPKNTKQAYSTKILKIPPSWEQLEYLINRESSDKEYDKLQKKQKKDDSFLPDLIFIKLIHMEQLYKQVLSKSILLENENKILRDSIENITERITKLEKN